MTHCPRCHHSLDEHDFQRCNHLAGTAERCRCWVGDPKKLVPRWYGPLVAVLLCVIAGLVLSGCYVTPADPVRCTGTRRMLCDCATSCVTTEEQVMVVSEESCVGVTVCYDSCDGSLTEECR